jgi:hypothetical protein
MKNWGQILSDDARIINLKLLSMTELYLWYSKNWRWASMA